MQLYQTSSHDLFADAFFILHDRLMFASLYGRDANMLSLLAQLNSGSLNGDPLGFRLPEDKQYFPEATTARYFSGLEKRITKLHTHQYGVLAHTFLYGRDLVKPDRDRRSAWIISDNLSSDIQPLVWASICQLADVPLADCWADFVLARLKESDCLKYFLPGTNADAALVGVQACEIRLPPEFDTWLSIWLKTGKLTNV